MKLIIKFEYKLINQDYLIKFIVIAIIKAMQIFIHKKTITTRHSYCLFKNMLIKLVRNCNG